MSPERKEPSMYPTLNAYIAAVGAELTPDNFAELDPTQGDPYAVDLLGNAESLAALYARDVAPRIAAGCLILRDVNASYVRSNFATLDEQVDALIADETRGTY
jgi:hypothetical protein